MRREFEEHLRSIEVSRLLRNELNDDAMEFEFLSSSENELSYFESSG